MKNNLRLAGLGLATTFVLMFQSSAQAFDFTFSFDDDPSDNLFSNTHVPGTVTGRILGLADNTQDQLPTSVFIDSHPITSLDVDGKDLMAGLTGSFASRTFYDGFDVQNGEIQSTSIFTINFVDNNGSNAQIRFGESDQNLIRNPNSGGSTVFVTGNEDGFSGISYSSSSATAVPFGVSTDLSLLILGGMYGASRLRKTIAARNQIDEQKA